MDYLSRQIEYLKLVRELEIGGDEHLKVILKEPSSYLKKLEEVQKKISADEFLWGDDKERMLQKINIYIEKVKPKRDDDMSYLLAFLAGALVVYMLKDGGESAISPEMVLSFKDELGKILGRG